MCASVRIRTDTILDQDCILKATVFVCTSCTVCLKATVSRAYLLHITFLKNNKYKARIDVHGRVIVDNMYEFQHSSSRADCTFSGKISELNAEERTSANSQR